MDMDLADERNRTWVILGPRIARLQSAMLKDKRVVIKELIDDNGERSLSRFVEGPLEGDAAPWFLVAHFASQLHRNS